MATYYLFCDELDQAADWFEKALDNRDANVTAALQMETAKGLRASARWRGLAALANLPRSGDARDSVRVWLTRASQDAAESSPDECLSGA